MKCWRNLLSLLTLSSSFIFFFIFLPIFLRAIPLFLLFLIFLPSLLPFSLSLFSFLLFFLSYSFFIPCSFVSIHLSTFLSLLLPPSPPLLSLPVSLDSYLLPFLWSIPPSFYLPLFLFLLLPPILLSILPLPTSPSEPPSPPPSGAGRSLLIFSCDRGPDPRWSRPYGGRFMTYSTTR